MLYNRGICGLAPNTPVRSEHYRTCPYAIWRKQRLSSLLDCLKKSLSNNLLPIVSEVIYANTTADYIKQGTRRGLVSACRLLH